MKRRFILFLAAVMVMTLMLPLTAHAEEPLDLSTPGLRIGVATGTVQEQLVRQLYPQAKIYHFEKVDGCAAVAQGKIDYTYDPDAERPNKTVVRIKADSYIP